MLASRPGLGLKAVQDHFLEVLVLVLRYLVVVLVLVKTIQHHIFLQICEITNQ